MPERAPLVSEKGPRRRCCTGPAALARDPACFESVCVCARVKGDALVHTLTPVYMGAPYNIRQRHRRTCTVNQPTNPPKDHTLHALMHAFSSPHPKQRNIKNTQTDLLIGPGVGNERLLFNLLCRLGRADEAVHQHRQRHLHTGARTRALSRKRTGANTHMQAIRRGRWLTASCARSRFREGLTFSTLAGR